MKYSNYLFGISLVCAVLSSVGSFLVFYKNIGTLGNSDQWKFYASLAGFSIFFVMTCLLIIAILISYKMRNN
jgi:hypothetical protein